MEQDQPAHQYRVPSQPQKVLLAGFINDDAGIIAAALEQLGWPSIALNKEAEMDVALATQSFALILIDSHHIEIFAPHFIARIRQAQGLSSEASIIVVDNSGYANFKDSLAQSGANFVIDKRSSSSKCIMDVAQAELVRLQDNRTAANTAAEKAAK